MRKQFLLLLPLLFLGCSATSSTPWHEASITPSLIERNSNALGQKLHNHMHISKEATYGGNIGLGGCGCR